MSIDLFLVILWTVVGIANAFCCAYGEKCNWVSYWCCYAIMMSFFIQRL